MSSIIIAIEGVDGTGKSGLVELLRDALRGNQAVFSREPSDTGYRNLIKQCINQNDEVLSALLFAADHRHHIENVVKPALAKGKIVITDRYLHSHLAYQTATLEGYMEHPDIWLWNIYNGSWILPPDVVIHLTAKPETSEARIRAASRTTIDNYEKANFLAKVEANYQKFYRECAFTNIVIQISTENSTHVQVFDKVLQDLDLILHQT
jgi:dTMP kinase